MTMWHIFKVTSVGALLAFSQTLAHGYDIKSGLMGTEGNHERSVRGVCSVAPSCVMSALIKGVREPDTQDLIPWEMGLQRVFSLDGRTRDVSAKRARIQHIHGNPLPTRVMRRKQALKRGYQLIDFHATIPQRAQRFIGPNSRDDLWSNVTMGQLRNKLLAQSASWLCIGAAHPNRHQRWRKFGNLAHMIGDTFSASHTLRLAITDHPMIMSYSMDTVMWKQHVVGDADHSDFRFIVLQRELKKLAPLYERAAQSVSSLPLSTSPDQILAVINRSLEPIYDQLCEHVWVMDSETLSRPAGGSTRDWSAAMNQGYAMLPSGLTSERDLSAYLATLRRDEPDFFYPTRSAPDYCKRREVLACHWRGEVELARSRSSRVRGMFVPQIDRSRPQNPSAPK